MATSTTITQPALRITTKVLPGNKIQIQLPLDSVVGEEVDVLVMRSRSAAARSEPPKIKDTNTNILEFIETARQRFAKRTAEDMDEQIRAERDTWDS